METMRRAGSKAAVLAASAVIAAGAWTPASGADQAATAASPTGWRSVHVFGQCFGFLDSVTATGVNAAWAAGRWSGCSNKRSNDHQVARWNGSAWQTSQLPSGFGFSPDTSSTATAVAALSSSYAWAFIDREFDVQQTVQSFALLWRGGRWQTLRLADGSTITSAVAFSPSDAWAFGSVTSGHIPAAYALRFNGKHWLRVPMPIVPEATAAPGPHNIWAVGPVNRAAAYVVPHRWALAHWTGRRWRTTPLPNLGLSRFKYISGIWVVTDGSGGAWVAASYFNNASPPSPDGGVLLHWTGGAWTNAILPFSTIGIGPLAHDGHGGLWVAELPEFPACNPGAPCRNLDMVHYSAAGEISQAVVVPVNSLRLAAMRQIPGTDSLWAVGIKSARLRLGVVLKYGP